jgi:hypothetical protein
MSHPVPSLTYDDPAIGVVLNTKYQDAVNALAVKFGIKDSIDELNNVSDCCGSPIINSFCVRCLEHAI